MCCFLSVCCRFSCLVSWHTGIKMVPLVRFTSSIWQTSSSGSLLPLVASLIFTPLQGLFKWVERQRRQATATFICGGKTYTFGPENLWFESVARPRRRLIITKWFLCVLTVGGNRNDGAMKKHQAEVSASVDPLRRLLTARETTTSTGLQGQVSVKEKKKKKKSAESQKYTAFDLDIEVGCRTWQNQL